MNPIGARERTGRDLSGGLVACWAMNQFQGALSSAIEAVSPPKSRPQKQSKDNGEDGTMKTAEALSETFLGRKLTKKEKEKAGTAVHYAFGTLLGGVYGVVAEFSPNAKSVAGLPFGSALVIGADEIALPALKLSRKPDEYPASRRLYGLTSHLVWASTTELVRRLTSSAL